MVCSFNIPIFLYMKEHLNQVLNFFYAEDAPVSAYNNRLIFGVKESEFYRMVEQLEESKLIEAVGIRHTVPGYNTYQITGLGKTFKESGGFA